MTFEWCGCPKCRAAREAKEEPQVCDHEWLPHVNTFSGAPFGRTYNFCVKCKAVQEILKPVQRTPRSELRGGWYWARRGLGSLKTAWFPISFMGTSPFLEVSGGTWQDHWEISELEFGPRIEEPEDE